VRKACDQFGRLERGLQSIVILPITLVPKGEHQSSRPQALILDTPYGSTLAADRTRAELEPAEQIAESMPTCVNDLDGQLCEISISHDGEFATAVALVPNMDN
jgi:holo-[acyl-carrier protein] synthase